MQQISRSHRRAGIVVFLLVCACSTLPSPEKIVPNGESVSSADVIDSAELPDAGDSAATPAGTREEAAMEAGREARHPQSGLLINSLLFFPVKYPAGDWTPADLDFEDVWISAADGTRIHAWFCPVSQPRAVVLYAHGNAGHLADRAPVLQQLNRLGLSVMIFDYRGYGRSEGTAELSAIIDDALAARKRLAELAEVTEAEIVLMGRSLGGAISAQLSRRLKPRALVIQSSFSSLRDIAAHHYRLLSWTVPKASLDSTAALQACDAPLLQSHGDADKTIPIELARKLHSAATGRAEFIVEPGADHNTPPSAAYYQALDSFIDSLPAHTSLRKQNQAGFPEDRLP
jgi:pimeloyl-ACP methyl ester carboxylesterase